MAPITDLTWTQFNAALVARLGLDSTTSAVDIDAYGVPAALDLGIIMQDFPIVEEEAVGVVKFMAILFDACRDAQIIANTNQPVGERLNAFADPTTQAPVGTLVPVTRTMVARADLSSVTRVVGRVA